MKYPAFPLVGFVAMLSWDWLTVGGHWGDITGIRGRP